MATTSYQDAENQAVASGATLTAYPPVAMMANGFVSTDGSDTRFFNTSGQFTDASGVAPSVRTLTDASTITLTVNTGWERQIDQVTLAGNRTLVISGAAAGMVGTLLVTQDATGSRTLTLPTTSRKPATLLTTTASATDRLTWECVAPAQFVWSTTLNIS